MKKSFDQLFNEVLGQNNILGQAPKIATTNTANKPNQPQQNQPAANQQAQQNQQQQPDPELENAFKTLMAKTQDPKQQEAIKALQQMLAQQQQQQNAANKPA